MTTENLGEQPKGVAFGIELRLGSNEQNLTQLKNWPVADIVPDFIVASSGTMRLELAGKLAGVKEGHFVSISKGQEANDVNCWWPDYIGGFALNLGRAIQKLRQGAAYTQAAFIDEPTLLTFQRLPGGGQILVEFKSNDEKMLSTKITEIELRMQVRRALQDLQFQLLKINVQLAQHPDLQELNRQIENLQ